MKTKKDIETHILSALEEYVGYNIILSNTIDEIGLGFDSLDLVEFEVDIATFMEIDLKEGSVYEKMTMYEKMAISEIIDFVYDIYKIQHKIESEKKLIQLESIYYDLYSLFDGNTIDEAIANLQDLKNQGRNEIVGTFEISFDGYEHDINLGLRLSRYETDEEYQQRLIYEEEKQKKRELKRHRRKAAASRKVAAANKKEREEFEKAKAIYEKFKETKGWV